MPKTKTMKTNKEYLKDFTHPLFTETELKDVHSYYKAKITGTYISIPITKLKYFYELKQKLKDTKTNAY